MFNISLIRPK